MAQHLHPLANANAVFGEQASNLVDLGGTLFDLFTADTVKRLNILLREGLDRKRPAPPHSELDGGRDLMGFAERQ
jgi:hypothetical protein